jgi:hypothetical protein
VLAHRSRRAGSVHRNRRDGTRRVANISKSDYLYDQARLTAGGLNVLLADEREEDLAAEERRLSCSYK